jgi:hypothetical protein
VARRYSDVFGVSHEGLESEGALDAFLDVDSPLHVDPYLLRDASAPELTDSHQHFTQYFEEVFRLLVASRRDYDPMYRSAVSRLHFPELPNVALGYSKGSRSGSGIGRHLALQQTRTASQIVEAGIMDPVIFELVGLFEPGIGADRVSDMTIRIVLPDLLDFSQRVAGNLGIVSHQFTYRGESYALPYDPGTGRPVVLVPSELLRHLPIAQDWSDIDYVCQYNEQLRRAVNEVIGSTWKDATNNRRVSKRELKATLLRYPDLLEDLVTQYTAKSPEHYDYDRDPVGIFTWHEAGQQYADQYPLDLGVDYVRTAEELLEVVRAICRHFRRLVESNGLNRVLYVDGDLRHERHAQLLFFAVADAYCEANDLDLSREPNAGRGPVDFKVSRGYRAQVNVEVKYSSNTHLRKGYTTQLPIYNEAERVHHSIYLIIQTTDTTTVVDELMALREDQLNEGLRAPEIFLIDGRIQPSASRA